MKKTEAGEAAAKKPEIFAGVWGELWLICAGEPPAARLSKQSAIVASELERERLYGLYRQIFPKQWKQSKTNFRGSSYNDCHTEREIEFIELINEHYFPLCSWHDPSDFRFDHIPIESVNYDLCCDEYEWQHFRPCLQFAICAFLWRDTDISDENWTDMLASFDVRFEDLPNIERATPVFSVLDAGRDNPNIRRFIHLIEFIFHDSGNPFIDTTYCQPQDLYEWSQENLEKLKIDYSGVKDYFESMDVIDEDIARNARSTFKELITDPRPADEQADDDASNQILELEVPLPTLLLIGLGQKLLSLGDARQNNQPKIKNFPRAFSELERIGRNLFR